MVQRGTVNIDFTPYRDGGRLITTSEAAALFPGPKVKTAGLLRRLVKQGKLTRYPGPRWYNHTVMIMLDRGEVEGQIRRYLANRPLPKPVFSLTPPAGWVTPNQAAALLGGVTRQRVAQLISDGELVTMPHPQSRRRVLVSLSSIHQREQRRRPEQMIRATRRQQVEQSVLRLLGDGPRHRGEIAEAISTSLGNLAPLLHRLSQRGLIEKVAPGRYALTPAGSEERLDEQRRHSAGWVGSGGGRGVFLSGEELSIYLTAREGKGKVPFGFWRGATGEGRAAACVRYVAEERHGAKSREDIIRLASMDFFRREYLEGARKGHTVYELFNAAFPEYRLMPWELGMVPNGYWKRYGDAAIVEEVKWCLDRLGKTAAEAAIMLDENVGLVQMLVDLGLSTALAQRSMRYWLRLIDPMIAAQEPPGERRKLRLARQDELPCPLCGKRYVALGVHVRRTHKMSMAELSAL